MAERATPDRERTAVPGSVGSTAHDSLRGEDAMKELILNIVRAMVDDPDSVSVSEVIGDQMTVFELNVAKEDLGKVIGKQGRTARAIRTLVSAASAKIKKRMVLEIIE